MLDRVSECPACGSAQVKEEFTTQAFTYLHGGREVELNASVPVIICADCELSFTDERGEDARHEAVCNFLGVLPPAEIVKLRRKYGLSQSEFARLTRIGEASIKRWESGALIQNASTDTLLRLLRLPGVMDCLRQVDAGSRMSPEATGTNLRTAKFRTDFNEETIVEASVFKLRHG